MPKWCWRPNTPLRSPHTDLLREFSLRPTVPVVFCAGLVHDRLATTGYMENMGWLLVSTPEISRGYSSTPREDIRRQTQWGG